MTLSYEQRVEISELTKEKHSKENWIESIYKSLDITIENFKKFHKSKTSRFLLTDFMM